ncbi:type II secretion system protein GspL [Microbulbifer yueqingensis]|uniref:Type II secretion system protein L n=1 Tax=Microbulbifer yueqingensis TaxID=658219 RepID=A0A1G8ZYG8_9GAMM|nr:type II secretion system protein GspL [Microbulbifer yueqingensis]SDK19997.1 type II secretion system protein L [Microbulbifer yueqingensis]
MTESVSDVSVAREGQSERVALLRLQEAPDGTGTVSLACWTASGWRPVAVDEEFSRAFAPAGAEPRLSPQGSEALKADFAGTRAVLLLPGSWVWSGVEAIPRAARKQSTAVGYMVEERLAEDVEELHFACQPRRGDLCSVYAIRHDKMRALYNELMRLQWPVVAMLPEYQLLELLGDDSALWLDGEHAHIWRAEGYGLTVRRQHLQPLLGSLGAADATGEEEAVDESARLSLLGAGEDDRMAVAELESLFGEDLQQLPGRAPDALLERLRIPALVNLLSGDYRLTSGTEEGRWWVKPAQVAAACFVLQLLVFIAAGSYYSWQASRHEQEARALFAELFPGARAGVDIRRQIQGYLNQAGSGGAGFARQVTALSRAWEEQRGENLKLQSLRFDGNRGEMVIQLQAASLNELDGFVGRLSSGEYSAELLGANELEDGVSGRIRLR